MIPYQVLVLSLLGGLLLGPLARATASAMSRQMQNEVNALLRDYGVDMPAPARLFDFSEFRPLAWLTQGKERIEAACVDCCAIGAIYAAMSAELPVQQAAVLLSVIVVLGLLVVCDIRFRVLPDPFVYSLLWGGLVTAVCGLTPCNTRQAVVGAAACYVSLWGLQVLIGLFARRHAVGAGDMKLAAAIGAWVGVELGLIAIMVALSCGLLFGVFKMRAGKRTVSLAFGPMLIGAGFLTILFAFSGRW